MKRGVIIPRPIAQIAYRTNPPQDIDVLITWAAGADPSGLQVVAVWASKAQADRYAAEQLFPAFQEFGLAPDMMEMTDYDADEFYLRSWDAPSSRAGADTDRPGRRRRERRAVLSAPT